MNLSNKHLRALIWLVLIFIILINMRRILADPTVPDSLPSNAIVINEFMTDNRAGLMDEEGDYSDWIELYNRSGEEVVLRDWALTDDPTQPMKWPFRSITLASGDYLVIFASGKDRRALKTLEQDGEVEMLHTNFRLNAEGGFLALYDADSRRYLDSTAIHYPVQSPDTSYGRATAKHGDDTGIFGYFATPTPGEPNHELPIWEGMTERVAFSQPHGFYDSPITVQVSSASPNATIRYTTDGTDPTAGTARIYEEPIAIEQTTIVRAVALAPKQRPSPSVTQSYIFIDSVLTQSKQPPGFPDKWPPTWGAHHISFGGYQEGAPRQADYAMDPAIVQDPTYGPQMREALLSIPSLSLVLDPQHLDIYAEPGARGPEAERPVSVEWIDPGVDAPNFQMNAGIRIQGGAGRWEFMPKHSFRLFFKQQYGASKLNQRIFENSPVATFDTLTLRAGVDRSFAGHPPAPGETVDHRQATYTRDEWLRQSQIALSGVGSHGRFVHLYLNRLYWGLYNIVERPDHAFASAYLGGDKTEWYSANHGGSVSGQPDRFNVMLDLATQGGLADPDRYATLLEFVDPVQFSDYVLLNWYAGNRDWPDNNWYVNVRYPAGRNLFFVWDGEATWDEGATVWLGEDGSEGAPFPNVTKLLFTVLMENAEFQLLFADRAHEILFNDGHLSDEAAQARWLAINDEIEPAIVAESARWGDVRYDAPITPEDWLKARDRVLAQMTGNAARLVDLMQSAGLYPTLDPPAFSQHGGVITNDFVLNVDAAQGEIYFTLDGSDPRVEWTGEVSSHAIHYVEPIMLNRATTVWARTLHGDVWSALTAATFYRQGEHSNVRISEIMYNPEGGERYEFIELSNTGALPVDLSSAYFEGIQYRFPRDTELAPGEVIVLVQNFKKFRERYPEAEIYGVYVGRLSDRGEWLALRNANGELLTAVGYDDEAGWPLSADGLGDSLVLIDPTGDPNTPQKWRASAQVHGSPGVDQPAK